VRIPQAGEPPLPIACTLDGAEAVEDRLAEWRAVLAQARARQDLPSGVRVEFGARAPIEELARLAVAEQDCCRFFAFAITVDGRGVGLEVEAPPDALEIVTALFGAPARAGSDD
jgi:hypothetical protein